MNSMEAFPTLGGSNDSEKKSDKPVSSWGGQTKPAVNQMLNKVTMHQLEDHQKSNAFDILNDWNDSDDEDDKSKSSGSGSKPSPAPAVSTAWGGKSFATIVKEAPEPKQEELEENDSDDPDREPGLDNWEDFDDSGTSGPKIPVVTKHRIIGKPPRHPGATLGAKKPSINYDLFDDEDAELYDDWGNQNSAYYDRTEPWDEDAED